MPAVHLSLSELGIFLSILLRVSIVLFMLPFYNTKQFPIRMKMLVSLSFAAILHPILRHSVAPLPFDAMALTIVVFGEILFGMVLAFAVLVVLTGVQFAGDLISFQMGFGFAQTVNPTGGGQMGVISRWVQLIAMMALIGINGHHVMLRAVVDSFRTIPIGGFVLNAGNFDKLMVLTGQLFVIGIQLAAPVMVLLLMIHLILGLVGKFAPQMNLMATSFPLTIGLGLLAFIYTLPIMKDLIEQWFMSLFHALHALIK